MYMYNHVHAAIFKGVRYLCSKVGLCQVASCKKRRELEVSDIKLMASQ